ncbi:hypothetical protein HH110_10630 [Stenotrophomonas sp. SAM-B]|uniref:hypothetical protein n=1 Tax=Stenotrophomonas sp. SAM-B TaxID=2729141 RepID=UPI0015A3A871|nr:hypothetical protein [Stenotrophomonas sp. SAM-B]NWF33493.1 hypothetical protein [Stenotrophomonas sp. SAM-B]
MSRFVARRSPKKLGGFSWGRFPVGDTGVVAYRLFRRDHRGALHTSILHFYPRDQRREVALALRPACHRLRDRVDEIDFVAMGVAA